MGQYFYSLSANEVYPLDIIVIYQLENQLYQIIQKHPYVQGIVIQKKSQILRSSKWFIIFFIGLKVQGERKMKSMKYDLYYIYETNEMDLSSLFSKQVDTQEKECNIEKSENPKDTKVSPSIAKVPSNS
jgi:hypothetical protein